MNVCILGRQPALGLAELESLYGSRVVRSAGTGAALVDADINFDRLGGSLKAGILLTTISSTDPQRSFAWLQKNIVELTADMEGKVKLGVSLYGLTMPTSKINANCLSLKKALRQADRSVRVVPNTEAALSTAQTIHNNLVDERGIELLLIKSGTDTLIARATHVQDIEAYRKRDQQRPHRDTYVGMLPPKLAQIIINLASGIQEPQTSTEGITNVPVRPKTASATSGDDSFSADSDFPSERSKTKKPLALSESAEKDVGARSGPQTEDMPPPTLLDPFCGTGVILQEAALMGYRVYGTDLNETMVRYSHDNLKWLEETRSIRIDTHYETVDAADHVWRQPIDIVACEGYLGHPFSEEPDSKALKATMQTCDVVMKKFLRNIHAQLTPGTRLCVAVPAWHVAGRVHHLPMLPTIESMGYRRVAFSAAPSSDLLYYREGQVVARELLVLIKP